MLELWAENVEAATGAGAGDDVEDGVEDWVSDAVVCGECVEDCAENGKGETCFRGRRSVASEAGAKRL